MQYKMTIYIPNAERQWIRKTRITDTHTSVPYAHTMATSGADVKYPSCFSFPSFFCIRLVFMHFISTFSVLFASMLPYMQWIFTEKNFPFELGSYLLFVERSQPSYVCKIYVPLNYVSNMLQYKFGLCVDHISEGNLQRV